MTLTQSGDGKQAQCPSCQQTVLVPDRPGLRRLRKTGGGVGAMTVTPPPVERETRDEPSAVHDMPTRVEPVAPRLGNEHTLILSPPQRPDEIGRLAGYRVLGVIGSGGMGVVFRAEDPRLEREVALKAMLPALAAHATARQRFLREARAAAALQHDRIVTIYEVGEDRGVPFLAMPFLRGETLEARIGRDAPVADGEIRRIGRELAEGLAAVHDRGLVHRDIKPGNVWLEGEAGRVKVLDFGLARARGDSQLTQDGSIVGSPAFMAPEQAKRQPTDARADLFSFGVVLYLMASGRLPFEGDDALSTLFAVTTADPAALPGVAPDLAALIVRLLAKDPADRPQTARVAMAAL
ncbi:MAG: serine/threonine-protein kinase [Gemmataceae bacterium]